MEKRTAGCEEHFNNLQWYSAILSELQELGTNHLGSMSSDLRNISLIAQNVHGDLNTLNLKLSHEFCEDAGEKHYFEVVDTDLPEAVSKLIQKVCVYQSVICCKHFLNQFTLDMKLFCPYSSGTKYYKSIQNFL